MASPFSLGPGAPCALLIRAVSVSTVCVETTLFKRWRPLGRRSSLQCAHHKYVCVLAAASKLLRQQICVFRARPGVTEGRRRRAPGSSPALAAFLSPETPSAGRKTKETSSVLCSFLSRLNWSTSENTEMFHGPEPPKTWQRLVLDGPGPPGVQ